MDLERTVAELLAKGDVGGAATATIEAHGGGILGYLHTVAGNEHALDVFSIWAEDVWRGLPAFRWECSLRTWCYRLAHHAAARFRRDPFRRRAERLPTSAASRLAASVAESAAPGSRRDRLRQLRGTLAPDERTLLALRVDRELEWDEIATVLSADGEPVTAAALRKRYERLKERLAKRAKVYGLLE
jgi:RNA polymerase sigma-70 factor (ECF subfamily)